MDSSVLPKMCFFVNSWTIKWLIIGITSLHDLNIQIWKASPNLRNTASNSRKVPWWFTHSCSSWPKFRKSLGSWPNQRRLSRIWRTGNGTCRTTVHPKMAQLKRMLRRLKNEAKIRERGSKLPVGDMKKKVIGEVWGRVEKVWKGYVSLIWISKWHLISLSFYSVLESTAGNPKHNSPLRSRFERRKLGTFLVDQLMFK